MADLKSSDDSQLDLENLETQSEPDKLQEFGQAILAICNKEQEGEIGFKEAYQQIKSQWKELKQSKKKGKDKDKSKNKDKGKDK